MRLQVLLITSLSVLFVRIFVENFQAIPYSSLLIGSQQFLADSIMLMENGLLQEVGTHQELLTRKVSTTPSIASKMHQSTESKLQLYRSCLQGWGDLFLRLSLRAVKSFLILLACSNKPALGWFVIWTIAAGTSAGLLWAFLGRVDQTVNANGTLQPVSGKMTVSSPAEGIVRQLFVRDGDMVAKGEVLMVVEVKARARLNPQKQLALFRYEISCFVAGPRGSF